MAPGIEPMPSLPTWLSDLKLGGAGGGAPAGDSKREKDIGEYVDKLAVAIAVREWEESVALVEQGICPSHTSTSMLTHRRCSPSSDTHSPFSTQNQSCCRPPTSYIRPCEPKTIDCEILRMAFAARRIHTGSGCLPQNTYRSATQARKDDTV